MKKTLFLILFLCVNIFSNPFDINRLEALSLSQQYSWQEYQWRGTIIQQDTHLILSTPSGDFINLQKGDILGWENALIENILDGRIILKLPLAKEKQQILFYPL